jgi:hypothetical protein
MPALKPDGTFDYSKMSLGEIHGDLVETVSDLAFNAGQDDLAPLLNALERDELDASGQRSELADPDLAATMTKIAGMQSDPRFHLLSKPLLREASDMLVRALAERST